MCFPLLAGASPSLLQRFRDQFSIWDFSGRDLSMPVQDTLLRMPLRTSAATCPVSPWIWDGQLPLLVQALHKFCTAAGQSLLTVGSLMRVSVKVVGLDAQPGPDALTLWQAAVAVDSDGLRPGSSGFHHPHRTPTHTQHTLHIHHPIASALQAVHPPQPSTNMTVRITYCRRSAAGSHGQAGQA